MRFANLVMFALFVWSVLLQANDPDPAVWMAMYGAAALACVWWERRWGTRWLAGGVGLLALGWAGWTLATMHLGVPLAEALGDWQMHADGSEEARESGGLLIVAAWMGVLWRWPRP